MGLRIACAPGSCEPVLRGAKVVQHALTDVLYVGFMMTLWKVELVGGG